MHPKQRHREKTCNEFLVMELEHRSFYLLGIKSSKKKLKNKAEPDSPSEKLDRNSLEDRKLPRLERSRANVLQLLCEDSGI